MATFDDAVVNVAVIPIRLLHVVHDFKAYLSPEGCATYIDNDYPRQARSLQL